MRAALFFLLTLAILAGCNRYMHGVHSWQRTLTGPDDRQTTVTLQVEVPPDPVEKIDLIEMPAAAIY